MEIQLAVSSACIFSRLIELFKQQKAASLVTIIETSGSTPQVAGAKAIVTIEGLEAGTIGGGSFETAMIERTKSLLISREAELIQWSFAAYREEEGSICGGQALVLINGYPEKDQSIFEKLVNCLERRSRGLLITSIHRKAQERVRLDCFFHEEGQSFEDLGKALYEEKNQFQNPFSLHPDEIAYLLRTEKPKLIKGVASDGGEKFLFLEPVSPPPRLLIFGAGHVGQAVTQLGLFLGFEIYLFDDRPALELPPGVKNKINFIVADMAHLEKFPTDDSCYLVIVTRDHRHDGQVLQVALKKRRGYVGMIGSRRKVALMKEDFLGYGWATEEEWTRVHSPIGLDIGARTVEEIALSIMAEIVAARRQQGVKSQ